MPDQALAGTERQFANLLASAAPGLPLDLKYFSLSGIPRSEQGRRHLEKNLYRGTDDLQDADLHAVIVTGTEPHLPALKDEPYWGTMARLFDWLEREGPPVAFSCLAAHAAVLHFDGIERRRLAEKRFGVFRHAKVLRSELTDALASTACVAHSRWNEIPAQALARSGYQILTEAPDAGVDLFIRKARHTWLFFQGHPEYDPGALGREYQRDVKRFLSGERETYPAQPENYFGETESRLLARFQHRAITDRTASVMEDFPFEVCRRGSRDSWSSPATGVFRIWLQAIADAKFRAPASQPVRHWPLQRALAVSRS